MPWRRWVVRRAIQQGTITETGPQLRCKTIGQRPDGSSEGARVQVSVMVGFLLHLLVCHPIVCDGHP
jgi:hypothetical protein